MEPLDEDARVRAARIRDEAAAAAQGDRSAWAHLLDVIHAPDARVKALEEIVEALAVKDDNNLATESGYCIFCNGRSGRYAQHAPICLLIRARILYPQPK